jgi:ribosomal protein S18 acetylase RimI-like enzyme
MQWSLRSVTSDDRDFLLRLHELAFREYVEAVWGWDPARQVAFFDEHFLPHAGWYVIRVDGVDAGRLVVETREDSVYLADIELLPAFQGAGIGTAVIRSVLDRAARDGKPVVLRVLHVNTRARGLYERLGFRHERDIETHAYLCWKGEA